MTAQPKTYDSRKPLRGDQPGGLLGFAGVRVSEVFAHRGFSPEQPMVKVECEMPILQSEKRTLPAVPAAAWKQRAISDTQAIIARCGQIIGELRENRHRLTIEISRLSDSVRSASYGLRAKFTLEQLQAFARVGGNSSWVRWWAHWNCPQNPAQMALSLMDENGETMDCYDLETKGFEKFVNERGMIFYICDRVDESGQPWVSRMV